MFVEMRFEIEEWELQGIIDKAIRRDFCVPEDSQVSIATWTGDDVPMVLVTYTPKPVESPVAMG